MKSSDYVLIYWGLGLAAGAYALLCLQLIRMRYLRVPVNHIGAAMFAAAAFTVLWSSVSLLVLLHSTVWWIGAQSADILRYLCWGIFLALFFKPDANVAHRVWYRWLPALVLIGVLGVPAFGEVARV